MLYLKADTNVEVLVGPAVAVGDGFTPVTNLSLSTADEAELIKYNGATALTVTDISSNTMAAITGADGYYTLDLSTGNLDTEGPLTILINDDSLILPIRLDFMVVNANVYDSLFAAAATDYLQTDTAQWLGTAAATPTTAGVPEVDVTHWAGTATTLSATTSKPEVDVNSISDDATAANNAELMFDGTGYAGGTTKLDVNAAQAGGQTITAAAGITLNAEVGASATAMDNFENMYDGTGYTDVTAPASRSQISALSVGSGGIATTAESVTIDTGGGTETNAYTDTVQENGTYHIIDVATDIDFYYQFDIGSTGVPILCKWTGYAQSNNDNIEVYGYNYGSTTYEQIGTIAGTTGTTVQSADFVLTTAHVGTTGGDLGKVRLRFESTGGDIATKIATDRVLCEYTAVTTALGFVNGAVWIDTNVGTAGTAEGVGTITTPSSNIDDAMTIAAANNLKDLHVAPNSTVTPTGAVANYEIFGHEYTIDLNGQSWAGTYINGATVAASTATGSGIQFESCVFDSNVTLPPCVMRSCYWGNMTITAGSVGNYYFNDCRSRVAGSDSPSFDFSTGFNTGLSMRAYSGGVTLVNMASGDTASIEGTGAITESTCSGGAVALRGAFKRNSITNITITADDNKTNIDAILADTGTDGVVLAGTPDVNVAQISGDATAADNLEASMETLVTGTATGGDTGEVQSGVTGHGDDTFIGRVLIFRTGTLQYEAGVITDYDSTAGTFTFAASTWTTSPTTETFVIV